MADDIKSDIIINVDTSVGISEIKNLQRQISQLNAQLLQSGAQQAKAAQNIQRNLINNINATGKFAANVRTISTTAESFTTALERNKLGFGETFRYAGAATKSFGRLFKSEFSTIEKVAQERVKTLQTQFIKLGRDGNGAMKAIAVRPLALDMDNLATKTAIAAQKQQLFNQLLQQGSTNLLNFGKNTQWAGRQLMVGFTIPLAYLGSVAAKTFMQMEEQAIKFKRVYGDTFTATEDTDKMIKQVQKLASEFTKYGVQAEKTMEMAASAAAMGLTNVDLLAQVNQATRLSVLGGVEQEQALETTISLMNAFGVEAKNLAGSIDFLNAVENQTIVAIEDMTIAIPKAAPVIKQLGGDMEDLAFFMTAMKEGGINASEGANALKSGLASLINPAGKANEFLLSMGVNLNKIVEANKGDVRGLVVDFAGALDTLDPLNRAKAIEQLFGKFQFARLSTLFQNVVKEGTQAQRVAEISRQTAEELAILSERELKRVEDSPMYKFKKAVEDLKVSLVPLGESFLKAITPVVEFAKGLLDKFNSMSDGAKNFVVILTTLFAGIGPVLLMTFGLIANGAANLIKMFSSIGKIFRGTSNSSKDLAFSTEYMTQQQLEASAVASSLDQTHAKLIQTFNVEAVSVDKLASAYGRAVAAQSRLLNVPIGPRNPAGQKPMKLSTGILSVPGPKGAGDVVPAMLSPGEAVIPVKQSQKYAGLIQGMMTDSIPGYSVGRNPFASMLKRSRVSVRTKKEDLLQMLQGGKTAKYESAFTTGTGADYRNQSGGVNEGGKKLRAEMEAKVFGLGSDTPASQRPTYGSLRTSPGQAIVNRFLGNKGRQYNAVTSGKKIGAQGGTEWWTNPATGRYEKNPKFQSDTLKNYGDIDLVTKRSVGKRSKVAVTDALLDYQRSIDRNKFKLSPVSMFGKGGDDFNGARFDRLSNPFGSYKSKSAIGNSPTFTSNPKPPYIETYTPGGFGLNEVSKIRVPSRKEAREIQKLVDQAGLRIRVTPQNAPMAIKALSNIFGTRFAGGTESVESQSSADAALRKRLYERLRGAPSSISAEFKGVDWGSRAAEEELIKKSAAKYGFKPDQMRDILGRDISHERKSSRRVVVGGQDYDSKLWEFNNLRSDSALVNRTMANIELLGSPKGSFLAGIRAEDISRMSGLSLAEATTELENIKKGNHPMSRAGYRALSSLAQITATTFPQMSTGKRSSVLKDLIDFRLKDKSSGSYFKAMEDGKLKVTAKTSQDSERIAKAESRGRVSQNKRIETTESRMSPAARTMTKALTAKRGIKGYNKGVVSVPGPKGKGDIVPAMLAPGEAVIPAKMSEKYGSLISGMVNGTIPGYEDGLNPFGPSSVGAFDAPQQKKLGEKIASGFIAKIGKGSSLKEFASGFVRNLNDGGDTKTGKTASKFGKMFGLSEFMSSGSSRARAEQFNNGVEQRTDKNGNAYYVQEGKGRISREDAMQSVKPKETRGEKFGKLKENYSNKMGRVSGAAGGAAGAAVMGAMMVGMGEGPMAQTANDMMPALLALSVALPLLGSIPGAIAVAVGAVVGSIMLLNAKFDDAQKKVLEYSNTMKASNQAMQSIAKFGGRVTASEAMDRRRSERDRELGAVAGKTTYGEAFVQTEAGKAQSAELAKQLAAGNRSGSIKDMSSQLSSAVLSGAMDFSQARSMAANLALEAGDASIAIDVIANMEKLLGPDGTDVLKDPLGVRINALQANQKAASDSILAASTAVKPGLLGAQGSSLDRNTTVVGAAAAGAGVGAAIGSLATPVGAVIGSIIGGIAGAATAYFSSEKAVEEYGKLGAASAVDAKIALEQNKELLDSMDMFYEKKIAELKVQGKINEANETQATYLKERKTLTDAMAAVNQQILADFNANPNLQESLTSGAVKATDARYKDDADQIAYIDAVRAQSDQLKLNAGQEYLLELKMSSGEIPPATMRKLLGIAAGSEQAKAAVLNIVTKFSGDTAGRTAELGAMLGDDNLARELTLKVDAQPSDGDAQDLLNNISELTRLNTVIPAKVAVDFYLSNPDAYKKFNKLMDEINTKKPKTIKAVLEIAPELKGKISKEEEAYFNTLSDDEKVNYTKTLTSQLYVPETDIIASPDYLTWLGEDTMIDGIRYGGAQYKGASDEVLVARYRAGKAFKATSGTVALAPSTTGTTPEGGGTGGARNEPLDDPLQRLKEIRDSRINEKGGKKELMRLLGGKKDITRFTGMEQLLTQKGGSSEFVDYLMGLDDADQKKFFNTNKKTGAISLTDQGTATKKAFNEIALGEFQSGMVRATADVSNQTVALQRLVASGMSVSEAYASIEDTAFAAAVATKELTNEELKKITDEAKRAEKALREFAAVRALREDITGDNRNARVTEAFSSGNTKFDFAQQQAILQDSNLMEIYGQFLSGEIANLPADFGTRLQQVMNKIDFKEGIFTDGLNKAMDKFSAQERSIEIKAELSITGDRKIAEIAQNEIAALQFEMDDYQAGLQEIAWKEEEINKAYEKKYEALDKIEDVNQRITAQQQKQLSLADALSRGDIAAAARAAQEMRDQSAKDALSSQRQSLERAEKLQVDSLLSKSGMTREQLEKKVLDNQKKIFTIEESRLEPAQENIRRAEAAASLAKQDLKVAGKTKLEWDQISNGIEVSKTGSQEYVKAIDSALGIVKDIEGYYSNTSARASNVQNLDYLSKANPMFTEKVSAASVPTGSTSGSSTSGNSGGNSNNGANPNSSPNKAQNAKVSKEAFDKTGMSVSGFIRKNDNDPKMGSSKALPITAPALTEKSSEKSPQTFTVGVNEWFKMPKGANVYSTKSDGGFGKATTKWTLSYGKGPGLYTSSQGKTREWWSTKFGVGASGNSVQANEGLGFGEIPKDAHKQYSKSFPMDAIGFNTGGFVGSKFSVKGADTVPAMLTPGEFVMRKYAVENFGADKLKAINNGTYNGDSMYNYEVNVNVQTESNPDQIARAVIGQIKQIDSQRIRGNRF